MTSRDSSEPISARLLWLALRLPLTLEWRFRIRERIVTQSYEADMAAARERDDMKEFQRLRRAQLRELSILDQKRVCAVSRQLVRRAHKYQVSVPKQLMADDNVNVLPPWKLADDVGLYYLDETASKQISDEIRDEIIRRNEARAHTINWITAITGLVGAVAAVIGSYAAILALRSR